MKKEMFCDALKIGWFKEKNKPVVHKDCYFFVNICYDT